LGGRIGADFGEGLTRKSTLGYRYVCFEGVDFDPGPKFRRVDTELSKRGISGVRYY